jgi:hypothetical protein
MVIGWMWLVTFSVSSGKEWGVQSLKFLSLVGHSLTGVIDGLKLMTTSKGGLELLDYFPNIFSDQTLEWFILWCIHTWC